MRIVIDENGGIEKAYGGLTSIPNETGDVLPGGEIPDTPIARPNLFNDGHARNSSRLARVRRLFTSATRKRLD